MLLSTLFGTPIALRNCWGPKPDNVGGKEAAAMYLSSGELVLVPYTPDTLLNMLQGAVPPPQEFDLTDGNGYRKLHSVLNRLPLV